MVLFYFSPLTSWHCTSPGTSSIFSFFFFCEAKEEEERVGEPGRGEGGKLRRRRICPYEQKAFLSSLMLKFVTRLTHLFRWPDPQAVGDLPVSECDGIKIALHPRKYIFALFLGSMHLSFDRRAKTPQSWHSMQISLKKPSPNQDQQIVMEKEIVMGCFVLGYNR